MSLLLFAPLSVRGQVLNQERVDYSPLSLRAAVIHGGEVPLTERPRSVPLALGLSAVIPGAGQVYNGDWIKASIAIGLEIGVFWAWSSWRSKGRSGRDEYEATAHAHWSPVRYALWLNDYADYLNSLPGGAAVNADDINVDVSLFALDFSQPGSWSSAEQLAVRNLILDIRALELIVYHPETGARFSHQLPFFGEQQYYELIGKYFQFAPGWDDYEFRVEGGVPTWIDSEGMFLRSIDPELSGPDGSKPNVSRSFYDYADRHGEANDYLRRASRVTILFFVNHILAAAEAAVSARIKNNRLKARMTFYEQQATVSLQVRI